MVEEAGCRVVIIQTDNDFSSVMAESLYNGTDGTKSKVGAQNNSATPRSARGPPTASSRQGEQLNVSYAPLEEAEKHAGSRCESHVTPQSARGPPTPSSSLGEQWNMSYTSLEEARKHAGSKCEYHMNILREQESTTGAEVPIEAYTCMHHTDECLSPHNP